jgi:hypothetical protein
MRVFLVTVQTRWIAWLTFIVHNRTVRSMLALTRVCPFGLNATDQTMLVWPVRGWPSEAGRAGSVTFGRGV